MEKEKEKRKKPFISCKFHVNRFKCALQTNLKRVKHKILKNSSWQEAEH